MRSKHIFISLVAAIVLFTSVGANAQQATDASLERLSSAAQTQNITLSDSNKADVQAKCRSIQTVFKTTTQREQKNVKNRRAAYEDIQNQVLALELRLKRQGVQIDALGDTLTSYKKQLTLFDEKSQAYLKALNDTSTINCEENPEAFIAGVNLVRLTRGEMLEVTNNLHNFVRKALFSELENVKQELKI